MLFSFPFYPFLIIFHDFRLPKYFLLSHLYFHSSAPIFANFFPSPKESSLFLWHICCSSTRKNTHVRFNNPVQQSMPEGYSRESGLTEKNLMCAVSMARPKSLALMYPRAGTMSESASSSPQRGQLTSAFWMCIWAGGLAMSREEMLFQ